MRYAVWGVRCRVQDQAMAQSLPSGSSLLYISEGGSLPISHSFQDPSTPQLAANSISW